MSKTKEQYIAHGAADAAAGKGETMGGTSWQARAYLEGYRKAQAAKAEPAKVETEAPARSGKVVAAIRKNQETLFALREHQRQLFKETQGLNGRPLTGKEKARHVRLESKMSVVQQRIDRIAGKQLWLLYHDPVKQS